MAFFRHIDQPSHSDDKLASQRGNIIVIAVIVVASLIGVAGIAAMSVQSNIASTGTDRAKVIALYAAESGAVAAMSVLHSNYSDTDHWQVWFGTARDSLIDSIPSNNQPACAEDGDSDCNSYFAADQQARYEVLVLNNQTDPQAVWDATVGGFLGTDSDGRVVIRSTGFGPNNATARIEWEVGNPSGTGAVADCPNYAQRGMSELGAGSNGCMSNVDLGGSFATFTPNN
ncbi:MAG: hypothetical protein IPL79_19495 [Myxococcales bacterium]|nr:hypothetical protein [Myxococcales bacterium]